MASKAAGHHRVGRQSLDPRAVERLLRRTLNLDRGSAALRQLLGRTHFRPINIHLLSDREVLLMLSRLASVGEVHLTQTRWWTEELGRGDRTSGASQSHGTGGKAVTSTSEPPVDRRDRNTRLDGRPDDSTADRPMPPSSQPPEPKNWIEFHLVDDETEEPIANVPFKISMPDGSVAEHTSDGNGMIRIADLPPGYCDIKAIQDRAAFEVVGIV